MIKSIIQSESQFYSMTPQLSQQSIVRFHLSETICYHKFISGLLRFLYVSFLCLNWKVFWECSKMMINQNFQSNIQQTFQMKKILITIALLTLLAIQTQSCLESICRIGTVTPPKIPIGLPFGQLPSLPSPPPNIRVPKPPVCKDQPLSNKFTLSLSYACRPGVAFQSCLGEIVWNNAIVQSIVPCDYKFQTLNLQVTAQVGKNVLQLIGAGTSDGYGLLIDNVKLVRKGTSNSILVNGDFSSPNVGDSWGLFNDILGWEGKGIQIGNAQKAYGIGHEQLCELDGNSNYDISQEFTFNNLFQQIQNQRDCEDKPNQKTLKYNLEFDWAIRQSKTNPDTSKANVLWNDLVVASLQANNNGINHANIVVDLKAGDNVVQFDGTSFSDSYGVTIDNVKLTSRFNNTNLIVNGDFSTPCVGSGWNLYNGGILGWSAVLAEVGDGGNYNCKWRTGQVIELDSDSNQRYTQVVKISDSLFAQLQRQAASPIRYHC